MELVCFGCAALFLIAGEELTTRISEPVPTGLHFDASSGLVAKNGNLPASPPKANLCKRAKDAYVVNGQRFVPLGLNEAYIEEGLASWFGDEVSGNRTTCGEVVNNNSMTAVHTILPLPSRVRVTNLENGKSIFLLVNDRGSFSSDRIISVSEEAARQLGFIEQKLARVRVERLDLGKSESAQRDEPRIGNVYLETERVFGAYNAATSAASLEGTLEVATEIVELIRDESYRIRIGPFDSMEAAERARAILIIRRQRELNLVVE